MATRIPRPAFAERPYRWARRHRNISVAALDCVVWSVALVVALVARFDFGLAHIPWFHLVRAVPLALGAQIAFGVSFGLYVGRWRYSSFDEVVALAMTAGASGGILLLVDDWIAGRHLVPLGVTVVGAALATVGMSFERAVWRVAAEARRRPRVDTGASPLLVFGAGEGGFQVLRSLLANPKSRFLPAGLLDDDPAKRHLRVMGVRVVGDRNDIARAAAATGATSLLIAIPSAPAELVRQIDERARACGLAVKVLPSVNELYGAEVAASDIRDVTEEDLLGRRPIETDIDAIAGYLTGRRVLVTGAGGSIGSELCRQIHRFGPETLVMVDTDESALHATQMSIEGRALLDSPQLVLANIRDADRVRQVFRQHRPEVVFHAAALKHLTLLERHPDEAVRTNVWGTLNVLEAAAASGVHRFVNISTDKAADPVSVLGYTKRIAERLTAAMADRASGTYLSVRFGNVIGSRGSVLPAFRAQLSAGGPLTVTHPEVTRYFMTIPESVELVIQAGAIGRDGEALVLDMGEPVSIDAVARRLAGSSPRPVEIVYTGLRPGEKLHESLFGCHEQDFRPVHPLVSHVPVEPLAPDVARELPVASAHLCRCLRQLSAGLIDLSPHQEVHPAPIYAAGAD
ncbi:MAG TPA: nucleoside-diphosphate sugar epimerase/dehydratase [Acidimicrobiales bacterium]|nr:nucleoside-diphosphate sugar epimerase/dehydratase [Acidimicrobiales bacterium]